MSYKNNELIYQQVLHAYVDELVPCENYNFHHIKRGSGWFSSFEIVGKSEYNRYVKDREKEAARIMETCAIVFVADKNKTEAIGDKRFVELYNELRKHD